MNIRELQTDQKLLGAYYTPNELVDFILKWTIDPRVPQRILEPSAGDGQFIKRIRGINCASQIIAVEINKAESERIPTELQCDIDVRNEDFYQFYEFNRQHHIFDIVMGNPPYIRYQFLSEKQREFQSDILENNNLKSNKLINSWVAFSVATIEMLKPGGKFAFVLPTDLLQVSYAKQLRQHFKEVFSELNIITFKDLMFEGIQQDVLLVMGIKKSFINEKTHLRTIHISDSKELDFDLNLIEYDDYTNFNSEKWSSLNLDRKYRSYYDHRLKETTISLTDVAKVEVGITTGNNKYFVVNNEVIKRYSLDDYVRPLLGRSVEARGITFSDHDIQVNNELGKKSWLLDFNDKLLNLGAKSYIKFGEERGENTGYKLRIRNNWYEIPSVWSPDAFFLRRIGQFPKLIRNSVNAVSTDTFHRVKLLETSKRNINELIILFYSSSSLLSIELEGRVFGGGALEVLPGDMKSVRIPKISYFENSEIIFNQLDQKFRKND